MVWLGVPVFSLGIMAKLDKMEKFFGDRDVEDYPSAIQKVNVHIYDMLEAQKDKSGKVTSEIMKTLKKCFDYINLRLVKAHRESVANETKVRTMVTDSKAYEALVKRVSGGPLGEMKLSQFPTLRKPNLKTEQGFSVLVSPAEGTDVDKMKKDLKGVWKEKPDSPTPYDVVATKAGQLVLRVKTREDTEKMKTFLQNDERIKDKVKVTVPRRRRQRLLILSVGADVVEEGIRTSLANVLTDGGLPASSDVEVVRHYPTRRGMENWIVDVDMEGADFLLERKRVCIDLDRYRIVRFVPIVRCYRCQAYGHVSQKCADSEKCPKCAGDHGLKDCTKTEESCINCIRRDDDTDNSHRADSMECPCYQEYRAELLSKRL